MNDEILMDRAPHEDLPKTIDPTAAQWSSVAETGSKNSAEARRIVIASTFTVDLLERPLAFWLASLGIPSDMSLAPYAQVMQELLNPERSFATNKTGFNVLLLRLDDWIRDRRSDSIERNLEHLRGAVRDFGQAVRALRKRTSATV